MSSSLNAPKRILQLVSRDEPGGVQVLTEMIGAGMRARGIEVEILALIHPGSTTERLWHLGRVAKRILTGRFDAIYAFHAAAGLLMVVIGPLAGIRQRLSHLTAMPDAIRGRWRMMDKLAGRLGGYSAIIANSDATARAFSDFPAAYTSRIHTIPHGVNPLPPTLHEQPWKARLSIPEASKVVLSVGRLSAQKDYETVVRALAYLPGVHFAIGGDGPLRAQLEALAIQVGVADRLHLPGAFDRAELSGFLRIGDIYLSPSIWETFGLAAVEAQMAGLPVIASDLPVLHEVLGASALPGTLAFHPRRDADALALAVRAMLAGYPSKTALGAAAVTSMKHYGLETMIDRYLALHGQLDRRRSQI